MSRLLARLKEPSTYAGIASCLAGCGLLGLQREDWDQILGALVALLGAIAIFLKERTPAAVGASPERSAASAQAPRIDPAYCAGCGRPFTPKKMRH
jgi:hypothetical protein